MLCAEDIGQWESKKKKGADFEEVKQFVSFLLFYTSVLHVN